MIIALINTSDKQDKQSKGIVSLVTFDPKENQIFHAQSYNQT